MTTNTRFLIDDEVRTADGPAGTLIRVVVDPVAGALTHLVVDPEHQHQPPRLVPVDLVASDTEPLVLSCTGEQFEQLPEAVETWFAPGAEEGGGIKRQEVFWPFYALGAGRGMGVGMSMATHGGEEPDDATFVTRDRVPAGEVEIRRGEPVHAADGEIGRVRGLVVDPADHAVTHVLLDEGHLWGRKQVAIPIAVVAGVEEGVVLKITKDEVRDLPPVDVELWD